MVLFLDHTQHIIGLMQAKYMIVSQYWKKVGKDNVLLRLPGRLWDCWMAHSGFASSCPNASFSFQLLGKVATLLKILAAGHHACDTLSECLSAPISLKLKEKGIGGFFLVILPSSEHPGNGRLIFCVLFM